MLDTAPEASAEEARREAWLAARRQHITSTDVAAIMGLEGAWGSPIQVFLEKKELLEKGKTPTWLEAGVRLQKPILDWYADRRQVAILHEDPYALTIHPDHSVLAASLDARWWDLVAERPGRVVDAKNVRIKGDGWGEEGSADVPDRYYVQLHVQMECTGERELADLATLFAGADPAFFEVPYDRETADGCIYAAERFWEDHVLRDVPPPVDASEDYERWLNSRKQRYADYLEATPEVIEWRDQALQAALLKKEAEEDERLFKNQIRAFIGEHAGLILPGGKKVHFKRNKDAVEERTEELLRELASRANVDLAAFRQTFTTTKPGARPLLLGKE